MILPDDDSLVLPDEDDGPFVIDATIPAWDGTMADLLNLLPAVFRTGSLADRDAVLTMLGTVSNTVWARSSFVLDAQKSPRFAEGAWLDDWGERLGRKRQPTEADPAYRARLLSPPDMITPSAIKAAVDGVVAQFTPLRAIYLEPAVDAAYCQPATASDDIIANSNSDPAAASYAGQAHGVTATWAAFTQPIAGQSTANQTVYANTTRRLLSYYPGTANPTPPSYSTPNTTGGEFWIIPPADAAADDQTPHAQPVADSITSGQFNADSEFVAPATSSDPTNANSNNDSSSSTYGTQSVHGTLPTWAGGFCGRPGLSLGELIISEVEHRIAGGTNYRIIFDPFIASAI